MSLPPLPSATMAADPPFYDGRDRWYTAEQMREYARAAVAAEREACITVCDEVAARVTYRMSPRTMDDMEWMKLSGQRIGAWDCAAMIRARGDA